MGMGFVRQVSPLLHKTTLTTEQPWWFTFSIGCVIDCEDVCLFSRYFVTAVSVFHVKL